MQLISRPKRSKKSPRRGGRDAPGVALIFALTTIAILTAVAVDFSYNSRVNLELAVQSRDSLRARSLAMSGMTLARVLVHFQKQVDMAMSGMAGQFINGIVQSLGTSDPAILQAMLAQSAAGLPPGFNAQAAITAVTQNFAATAGAGGTAAAGGAPAAGAAGAGAAAPPSGPTIQLWKIVDKFDSNMIFNFINAFPMTDDKKQLAAPPPSAIPGSKATPIQANFGEFTGTFSIKISDEDQKINPARLAGIGQAPLQTVLQMKPNMDNPVYDFIFNEEDRNHDRVSRNDTLSALRDWVDQDNQQTGFDATLGSGSPFIAGGGDENGPYARYRPPYRAKNARFDSVDELRMVSGVNDAFMAAFGDRMTVYTDMNGKLNVNTDDLQQLASNVLMVAANPLDPMLQQPYVGTFMQILRLQIQLRRRMLPFIGMSPTEFLGLVQADGLKLSPTFTTAGSTNNALDNKSTVFRIQTTGEVGRVKKTLTAVVRYDDGLGQLLYWHED